MASDTPDSFIHIRSSKTREGIVELCDKFPAVIFRHAHKCAAHNNELDLEWMINMPKIRSEVNIRYLVDTVPETFQLFHSSPCLLVGVVTCTDSSHAGWFIASVALCTVLKV